MSTELLLSSLVEKAVVKVHKVQKNPEEVKEFVDSLYVTTGAIAKADGILHAALYICALTTLEGEYGGHFTSLAEEVQRVLVHAFISEVDIGFKTSIEKRTFIEENFANVDDLFEKAKEMNLERTERLSKTVTLH